MNLIPSVFASQKPSLPSAEVAFASFGCEGCGNHFSVQAAMSDPFCVLCGCDNTTRLQDAVVASALDPISEEANCGVVVCSGCDQHLVMSSAVEQNGVVFCSVCGTDNHFTSEAGSDEDEDDDEEDACVKVGAESEGRTDIEALPTHTPDAQKVINEGEPEGHRESNPADAHRNADNEEVKAGEGEFGGKCEFTTKDAQQHINQGEPEGHRDSNPANAHRNEDNEEVKANTATASVPGAEGSQPEFKFASEQEAFDASVAKQKLDQKTVQPDGTDNSVNEDANKTKPVSLLDIVRTSKAGNPPIRFGRVEASILAYVGHHTVAVLEEANVNVNVREHFKTQAYLEAIANSVEISGFDETLASFGFEMLTIASNDPALAALAQDRVEARAAELASATHQAGAEELTACLAIASTGITKQFFDVGNPIRDAMVAAFEGAGLRNPHRIVDEALASSQDGYNKALITEAVNLLSMPVEARNAIAKTVGNTRHLHERASTNESTSTVVASLRQPMVGVNEVTASVPRQGGVGSGVAGGNAVQRTVTQLRQEVGRGRMFGN